MVSRSHVPAIIELLSRGERIRGEWDVILPEERDLPLSVLESKGETLLERYNTRASIPADEYRIVYWDDPRFTALGWPPSTEEIWAGVREAKLLGFDEDED